MLTPHPLSTGRNALALLMLMVLALTALPSRATELIPTPPPQVKAEKQRAACVSPCRHRPSSLR